MATHITTGYPLKHGDEKAQLANVQDVLTDLIDQLSHALYNLDAGNVKEAASVKAENIDTANAKIKNAQIKSLTADKLTAGTIDTELITIKGKDNSGSLILKNNMITVTQYGRKRLEVGKDEDGIFVFRLNNSNGDTAMEINSDGQLAMTDGIMIIKEETGQGTVDRIKIGMDETGTAAFVIYDKRGDPSLYTDDNGDAIFKGTVESGKIISNTTIDVTEGINVGKYITLDAGNYEESVISFISGGSGVSTITVVPGGAFTFDKSIFVQGAISALEMKIGLDDVATKAWVEQNFVKK